MSNLLLEDVYGVHQPSIYIEYKTHIVIYMHLCLILKCATDPDSLIASLEKGSEML